MTAVIVIGIIIFMVVVLLGKNKGPTETNKFTNKNQKSENMTYDPINIYTFLELKNKTLSKTINGDIIIRGEHLKKLEGAEKINGFLGISDSTIESLGELKEITGNFWTSFHSVYSPLNSLHNLEKIGGDANFRYSNITDLGNLKYVGGKLSLRDTKIKTLGKLEYVGGDLFLPINLKDRISLNSIQINGRVRFWNDNNNTHDLIPSGSTTKFDDDSIIDVTDETYKLNTRNNLKTNINGVPYWAHHYVCSYSEINNATREQKIFYDFFKNSFLKEEYLDLEGNTNYAFILLFDLLNEYENHKDIPKLEKQLQALGQCYSKTKSYGISFLIQKMEAKGDSEGVSRLRAEDRYGYQNNNTDYDYWRLGSKYKTKLNLKENEVKLLNKLWYPSNNFCSVEFCCLEILKLYIATIAELKSKYIQEGTTLDAQFLAVADVIARKHFKYKAGSSNYKYSIDSTTNEFYSNIFKHCENAVREYYGHKRKINTDTFYTTAEAKTEFETKIISKVAEILPTLISKVTLPDEATEIELYSQNTSRWKIKFEELSGNYKDNPKQFIESIVSLGTLNKKNPSIENIFFEASKFISKYNKETALTLYVHYLYHDLKSATFDNKQLTKTIQKNLFKTNEQLHDFEIVVSELIKDKNLDNALEGVSKIYTVKRKKIQLDTTSIKEVQQQHSGTVELLNEYLKDEYEDENNTIKTQEINSEEVSIEITQKTDEVHQSIYVSDISFTQIHTTALEIFAKSNFSVSQSELETFAKSKGVFKNQLIESINEVCYENLDDVLIEEEDEYYTINPNYYQRLLAK